jgi:hypothetical protein
MSAMWSDGWRWCEGVLGQASAGSSLLEISRAESPDAGGRDLPTHRLEAFFARSIGSHGCDETARL